MRRQLAALDQLRSAVCRPAVGLRGVGAELVDIGQHDMADGREVIGGGAARQEGHPRLGSLADVPGLESGDIDLQGLAEVEISHLGDDRGAEDLTRRDGELTGGEDGSPCARPAGLGGGVEDADGVDLVPELLDPNRVRLARRPQVDEAATDGHLADAGYLGRWIVAGGQEAPGQLALWDAIANRTRRRTEWSRSTKAFAARVRRSARRPPDHARNPRGGKHRQASCGLVAVWKRPLERERAALRQDGHRVPVEPGPEVVGHAMGLLIGLDHDDDGCVRGKACRQLPRAQRARRRHASSTGVGGGSPSRLSSGPSRGPRVTARVAARRGRPR